MKKLSEFQHFFSTSYQSKTNSGENTVPELPMGATAISMPAGEYRVVGGKIARIIKGIPVDMATNATPDPVVKKAE